MQQVEKLRTAEYGRTSKDDPKKVTIEIQQKMLADWWPRDPLVSSIAGEYWDEGVSGTIPLGERPAGRRLLADVATGKVQCVAVSYVDRFGRTLLDGLQAVKELVQLGCHLVAVADGWDSRRNDSPLYFQFRMMMAEEEHRRICERMANGKLRAMDRDNAPPGGPLVFGYRLDESGRFVVNPDEAALVIGIFERFLKGDSQAQILAWAQTVGVAAGRKYQKRAKGSEALVCKHQAAARWHLTKIGKILRCKTYTGTRTWAGRSFPCPVIIDPDTFARVQALLTAKDSGCGVGREWNPDHGLLTGLLQCGRCNGRYYYCPMRERRADGSRREYLVYMCDRAKRCWRTSCKSKVLPLANLDERVWQLIESYLQDPVALVRKVVAADRQLSGQVADLEALEADLAGQLVQLEEQVKALWAEQRARAWPLAWIAPRLDELNGQREKAVKRLQAVRDERNAIALTRDESAEVTAALASIRARLQRGLSAAEKRHILELVIAEGKVVTLGEGRSKTAEITLRLKWGETLAATGTDGPSHKVPKD